MPGALFSHGRPELFSGISPINDTLRTFHLFLSWPEEKPEIVLINEKYICSPPSLSLHQYFTRGTPKENKLKS